MLPHPMLLPFAMFCGFVMFGNLLVRGNVMIKKILVVAGVFAAGWVFAQENHAPHTVALIVQNHAAPGSGIPMMALTDALTARLSGRGFQVVNPYNVLGENENRTVAGEALPKVSAIRLAQGLGAEGAITASVIDFLDTTGGNPPIFHKYVVRLAFNLADASTGATVCGETIKVNSPQYTVAQDRANRREYLGDLLHAAADQCAELLEKKATGWKPRTLPPPQKKEDGGGIDLGPKPSSLGPFPPSSPVGMDFTMSDFDKMFEMLVKSMLGSPRFKENYETVQTEKSGLPIVIVGGVTNKSDAADSKAYGNLLKAIPDTLRIELFNSNLFDVKNDEMNVTLAERILSSDKSPLEDGELMNALKQHGSPDFVVIGDIRLFPDRGKRKTCRFHLALYSLKTGKVVWEGKKTAIK